MIAIRAWALRMMARFHAVDAQIFANQGRWIESADAECRAHDCERRRDALLINARYSR